MRFLLDGEEQVWQSTAKVNVQSALATLAWELHTSNRLIAAARLDGADYDPDVHGEAELTSFGVLEISTQPKQGVVEDLLTQLIDLSETLLEACVELSGLYYMGDERMQTGTHDWIDGMNAVGAGLQQLSVLGLRMSAEGPFHDSVETALSELADAQEASDHIRVADLFRTQVKSALREQTERLQQWQMRLSSGGV